MVKIDLVVTRHSGLVGYLKKRGFIDEDTTVLDFARVEDIKGKNIFGVVPFRLAAECESVTELPLRIKAEFRGKELSVEEIEDCVIGHPVTYEVYKQ